MHVEVLSGSVEASIVTIPSKMVRRTSAAWGVNDEAEEVCVVAHQEDQATPSSRPTYAAPRSTNPGGC